jgi:RNA polymerase sigma factor (sigma-70 family)
MSIAAAGQVLRTSGETTLTDRELSAILATLPRRGPLRSATGDEPLAQLESSERADHEMVIEETAGELATARAALTRALASLPHDDRLILRMHYLESMSVADIARGLALPQKPLYRRLERLLTDMRAQLEFAGVTSEHVRTLTADPP